MKPSLNTTTLLIVDSLNVDWAIKIIERCKLLCDFAEIKLLTNIPCDYPHKIEIPKIETLIHYSVFMLKKAHEYIDTQHVLIVQRDGWIINPQAWNTEWLQYDYIGALFNQYDIMGVGGFSFRSKRFMEAIARKYPEWDGTNNHAHQLQRNMHMYEDGEIAMINRKNFEAEGFKYAPIEVAAKFAQGGNPNLKYYQPHPFGFHGSWREVNIESGFVHPNIKHDGIEPILQ